MVGILLSYWDCLFSWAMLVSGSVEHLSFHFFVKIILWTKMMPILVASHKKLKPSCSPVNGGFYRSVRDSRWISAITLTKILVYVCSLDMNWEFQDGINCQELGLPMQLTPCETTTTNCTCYSVDREGSLIQKYIQANTYATNSRKRWKMIPQDFSKAPVSPLSAAILPWTWQPGSHERSDWVRLQL